MTNSSLRTQRLSGSGADDQRDRFERDRDRILYTRAFRRLSGVTQVARANESYTYHDRLSHSLKVAQIGRRLTEYFLREGEGPEVPEGVEIHPDVVETAALAHDIGHPPFGHAAEQELNQKIEQRQEDQGENVKCGFEGNAQSFRVVTRLCVNSPNKRGLDLTLASLNAILKYPWKRGGGENKWGVNEGEKWGVYRADLDAFRDARQLSTVKKRRSAESDIMDWADDLAYAVHDMEDFYRVGIIPLNELLRKDSQERHEFVLDWADEDPDQTPGEGRDILDYIDSISGDTIRTPYSGTELERLDLKELSSKLISRYLGVEGGGIRLQNHNDERRFLQIEDYLRHEVSLLKHMTTYYVIQDSSLAAQQRGQREVISELFDVLYNATLPSDHKDSENLQIIPNRFRERAKELTEEGNEIDRSRLATDIITGMTESQTTLMHKRLVGDTPGSLQDRILQG